MERENIFESFNARYLSFEEVATTFIHNDQYISLSQNHHTLLMGPRGSGKTTLLKMLTPASQFAYNKLNGLETYPYLPFYSIYIPTDIQWKKQIEVFEKNKGFPKILVDLFPRFLVSNNIQICLLDTFKQLIQFVYASRMESSELIICEAELSREIINAWNLEKPLMPSLYAIEQALLLRIKNQNILIRKELYSRNSINSQVLPDFYYDDYFSLTLLACKAFDRIFNYSGRWALCFDELEISPSWLQNDLLSKLRSTDQKIIFKLTTSPIVSLVNQLSKENGPIDAREDEDFRVVRTWNFNKECERSWSDFSEKLATQRIFRKYGVEVKPNDIFGSDEEYRNLSKSFPFPKGLFPKLTNTSLYEKGNYYWQLFRELAIIDKSFYRFLVYKKIDPQDPSPKSVEQKDQILRKILPIAQYRFHYKNQKGNKRSRKNSALYYGVPAIFNISDGNPRFLISLLDNFIARIDMKQKRIKLDISQQSKVIEDFSQKYFHLIEAHPDSNKKLQEGRYINLADLINQIGNYFKRRLFDDEFNMDPTGTFIVDDAVPESILELIELGVHLGAFMYLNPKKVISNEGLVGKKLRISYLLIPLFKLPRREYKHVNLSSIIYKKNGLSKELSKQLIFDL